MTTFLWDYVAMIVLIVAALWFGIFVLRSLK